MLHRVAYFCMLCIWFWTQLISATDVSVYNLQYYFYVFRQSNDIDSYGWEGTIQPDLSHIVPPIPPPPPPPASFAHPWATAELQAPHFPQRLPGSNYHDPSVYPVRRCNCCTQSTGMPAPPQPVTAVPSSPPLKRFLHPYLSPPKPLIPSTTTLSPVCDKVGQYPRTYYAK